MKEGQKEKFSKIATDFLIGKGENPDFVIENLQKLKKYPDKEVVDMLKYFACIEKDPKVLFHIISELGKYRDKNSTMVLIEILIKYRENPGQYLKVRCQAANSLGKISDENAVLPLMMIMNDRNENYRLRLLAAESLGKIGSSQAVLPLIKIVADQDEKSVYLKESAAKALGMLDDERAVEPLIKILETKQEIMDKFSYLKEKIIEALGRLSFKKDRRIYALKNVLDDESPHVRSSAVEALSEIDDEKVIPLIEKMIFDKNESVAKTAILALYNVQGKNYILEMLDNPNLPDCCREEIVLILEEEEEGFEEPEF
jgi:hypothetical protein